MSTAATTVILERRHRAASPAMLMGASLALMDIVTLSCSVLAGFWVWSLINPIVSPYHPSAFLAVGLTAAALGFSGLYPGIGMTAVEHMRRIAHSVTLVYLLLTASMFLVKDWWADSRGGFLLSWALSLALVPLGRGITGRLFRSRTWWGVPSMILGAGRTAHVVIRNLKDNQVLGYRPVVCLDDDPAMHGDCLGVPVTGSLQDAAYFAERYRTRCAIVVMPGIPREKLVANLQCWSSIFPSILIVPDLFGVASLWTEPRDLGGVLALHIRCNLLHPLNRFIKRGLDIVVAALALLVSAPLLAVAALCIKRVSAGSAFYAQERQGKGGGPIRILKLRTMYHGAEQMLDRHLAENPEAAREWDRFCKLKRDPRILPAIGHFLRKTSLDELPQLWNVLVGEMSLVGPRPFPIYHNQRFGAEFRKFRMQVTPGLTGLWQISARSNGDLDVQTQLDTYYIKNWSIWLDIYILSRTAHAVLFSNGAY
ncbi:MAG: undecaprenyl-phosphate galactose phosphotransferase WbaP [Bryobacteraceae bacterium]|jgi:Undecaprenyl-phosphate galactose phosphotransferase WbaP